MSARPPKTRCRASRGARTARWIALVALLATAGCSSVSTTLFEPSVVKCAVSISPATVPVDATGGVVNLSVNALPECGWTAAAQAGWITDLSPASGQGSGQVALRVVANPAASPRHGEVLLNDARVVLTQAGQPAPSPAPSPAPGPGPAPAPAPAPSPGPAPSPAPSPSPSPSPPPPPPTPPPPPPSCSTSVTPTSFQIAAAGAAALKSSVSAGAGCAWSAVTADAWLTITSGTTGSGAGEVTFAVAANTGPARTGRLTVAGETVSVSQADGCTYVVAPTRYDVSADPAPGLTVEVTTAAGCTWTAVSQAGWITVTSGATGSGTGTVVFDVASNLLGNTRVGTLMVAGTAVTVRQDRWRLLPILP